MTAFDIAFGILSVPFWLFGLGLLRAAIFGKIEFKQEHLDFLAEKNISPYKIELKSFLAK